MLSYAMIGVAGYIAPRHLSAINEVGGCLVAAYDTNDSVGIIDSHFPDALFFTNFEEFQDFIFNSEKIDFLCVCSPNYLHRAHISFGLRAGANVICEKPTVLHPEEIDILANLEKETGKNVSSILQLRLHPEIVKLKKQITNNKKTHIYEVDLGYFTSRGGWYQKSWKGDTSKSGGIITNIGVHFFDMLLFLFGNVKKTTLHHRDNDSAAGVLMLENAIVRWVMSINRDHLPSFIPENVSTYRSITIDGVEVEFSRGFTDLHTASYSRINQNEGFNLATVRPAVELVSKLRACDVEMNPEDCHPMLNNIFKK